MGYVEFDGRRGVFECGFAMFGVAEAQVFRPAGNVPCQDIAKYGPGDDIPVPCPVYDEPGGPRAFIRAYYGFQRSDTGSRENQVRTPQVHFIF